jgi:hypothetical protein
MKCKRATGHEKAANSIREGDVFVVAPIECVEVLISVFALRQQEFIDIADRD